MRFSALIAALLVSVGSALAVIDQMSVYYGNTVVTADKGDEFRFHYKQDHQFDGSRITNFGTLSFTGSWAVDQSGKLCRTYDKPSNGYVWTPSAKLTKSIENLANHNPEGADRVCAPLLARQVGDSWVENLNGESRAVTLAAGIK
jgi:hypothetical protein